MKRTELTRRTGIKPVNRERKARRNAEAKVYGPYHRSMSSHPCAVLTVGECYGLVCGHHLRTVGAGGVDEANEVPLCHFHHTEVHDAGRQAFEDRHGIILDIEAAYLWHRWMEATP